VGEADPIGAVIWVVFGFPTGVYTVQSFRRSLPPRSQSH
jgi:hypothetical protein